MAHRRGSRLWAVNCVALVSLAGCVTSPSSDTFVTGQRVSAIEFTGLAAFKPRLSITIQVLEQDGTWTDIGSGTVNAQGEWQVPTQVPAHYWEPCGAAVFQALPSDGNAPLPGVSGPCLQTTWSSILPGDFSKCRADLIVLRRTGSFPSQFTGNLSIIGQPQAEQFRCFNKINGDLSVQGGVSKEVTLSALQEVTGNLTVHLNHFLVDTPNDTYFVTNALRTPSLTQVGGDVTLHATDDQPIGITTFDFGMNALTNVGGSVLIDNEAGIIHYKALPALTSIPGDLTLEWESSDLLEPQLLPSLAHVGGNLLIHPEGNIQVVLPTLAQVDGNVTIEGDGTFIGPHMLNSLTLVGGNLAYQGFDSSCAQPIFPALSTVTGQLNLIGGKPRGVVGTPALSLGALQLANTEVTMLPLPSGLTLAPTGDISIQQNVNLCQCQVDGFVSGLGAQGWSGNATTANNGAAAACTPCPTPTCL